MDLKSVVRLKKYRAYKGEEGKTAPNILKRKFNASRPFEKWATDVAEFISYSLSLVPNFGQITDMLDQALKKMPKSSKPILHSDQGWQYRMKDYQGILP